VSKHNESVYRLEQYGGHGYSIDPGEGNRIFSDDAFSDILELIRESGRAGVISLPCETFYIKNEILIEDTTGVEIRGAGGNNYNHKQTGASATIHQTNPLAHCIRIFKTATSKAPPSVLLHSVQLLGEQKISTYNQGDAAGVFIDDSETWSGRLDIVNCLISSFMYGVRTNFRHSPASKGIGYSHFTRCNIVSCLWGIYIDGRNGTNTTTRIRDCAIRANGHYTVPEPDSESMTSGGGVYFGTGSSITVSDCVLEANSTGIRLEYVKGGSFDGNYYEGHVTCAARLQNCKCVSMRNQYHSIKDEFWSVPAHNELIILKNNDTIDLSGCIGHGKVGGNYIDKIGPTIQDEGGNQNIGEVIRT
jgi:hypothetical protein|tara:strand:- start:7878 stop:8960 length:1083 start_codon:yes stop_codon:yes gene_type:complete